MFGSERGHNMSCDSVCKREQEREGSRNVHYPQDA